MEEFVFKNIYNKNVEIRIKAYFYNEALETLLIIVRNVSDYNLNNQK